MVPTPQRSAERVGQLLKELMTLILQQSAGETLSIMAEASLSMPQIVTLHVLHRHGPASISAIASNLKLSLAATSHLVERLVQGGLVERSEDTTDRRQKRVAITEAGRTLTEQLVQARTREITQVLSELAPELQNELGQVLEQVVQRIKQGDEERRRGGEGEKGSNRR
jgi:DNA-binding MarR family transcriptional regulator